MNDENKQWKNKIEQLKSYPSEINIPMEWDALEKRMDRNKKRRLVYFVWPILIGLLVVAYQFYPSELEVNSNHEIQIDNLKIQERASEIAGIAGTESIEKSVISNHNDELEISQSANSASEEKEILMTRISTKVDNKKAQQSPNLINSEITTLPLASEDVIKESDFENIPLFIPSIELENIDDQKMIVGTGRVVNSGITSFLNTELGQISSNQLQNFVVPQIGILVNNHSKYWLDFRTSFGRQFWNYDETDIENNDFANTRKVNEKPLESINAKISLGRDIGSDFYISGGIGYTISNEKWKSVIFDTLDKVLDNQVIEEYTNHQGLVTQKFGSINTKQRVEVAQTRYNSIRTISANLAIGKYFIYKKYRFLAELNLGIPIFTDFKGSALNQNNEMVSISSIYLKNKAIQLGFNTSYIYPVSGNMAMYGGYDYTYTRLQTSLGYLRRQNTHSISIGVRYLLKN